ncbi:MAG: S9 family peptidase [Alphaproteobacteria bacterium]|nr:S9 family peptidase [Alphaproteobacteria bacterium]
MPPTAPEAPQHPVTIVRHGHARTDPYVWLRSGRWRELMRDPDLLEPEIRAHLEAENAYTAAVLAPVEPLRQSLVRELRARIKEDDSTVPSPDGAFAYYVRHRTGGEHPIYCRAVGGVEEVVLDCDREAEGQSFYRCIACRHSPDHALAAYAVDHNGAEYYTIHIREIASGRQLDAPIGESHGEMVWANDGRTLFYTVLDRSHRPVKVMRHRVGEDPAQDTVVYEEPDPGFYLGLSRTESRRYVVIEAHDHTTSELYLIAADRPLAPPECVLPRERDLEYALSDHGDRFLILTNADGAEDFQIVTMPIAAPARANWRPLVPHAMGRLIRAMLLFRDHLVRLEMQDALPRIVVRRLADGVEHTIRFAEEAYDLSLLPGHEFATRTLRFAYSSMTTPQRIYDYDLEARTRLLRKEQEVPSGHDPARYLTHRLQATAPDGAQVPVSLLYRRDLPVDGAAPVLLYGYGSYGISIPATFVANRFSLVDRGFVYAIAHVRGGKERGYGWYRAGRLAAKENTFRDFIAAAEALIAAGYTRVGRIAAHGGSAGGMLMGAVANLRPDLFGAIVAEVPFVDVLNTMSDASLPLTPPEWHEWGNPIESADAYRAILAYSPYDNVREQPYPHILAMAGLTDPRVTYWEPAKWVARLRARNPQGGLVLLRTNMQAGHGGAAGRFERLEEVALAYAFLLRMFAKDQAAALA